MVRFLRIIHLCIVIYLVSCIVYLYYAAWMRLSDAFVLLSFVSLSIEGAVIYLNKGNCPFGYIQQRYGDHIPFFEHILPKKRAKQAVRFFALLSLIAMLLYVLRSIRII